MKVTGRIAADTSELEVNIMCSHGTEETLHSYLRRHFEKMSKRRAGQFADQPGADVEFVLETPPTDEPL